MRLAGSNPAPNITGVEQLSGITNYIEGDDPHKWHMRIPNYASVKYSGVYPGVDLLYYGNEGQLEYDFIVHSGADPKRINLGFEGIRGSRIDANGDLLLKLRGGDVRLHKPVAYQEIDGVRRAVESRYVLSAGNRARFSIGNYDRSQPLVIDPMLTYSSYLSRGAADQSRGVALDPAQNAYVVGTSLAQDGSYDAFLAKFSVNGALQYLTK